MAEIFSPLFSFWWYNIKMSFLLYPFIFLFGLTIGSFLNSVIYRLEVKESAFKGRSYCPRCHHSLGWKDLIPLFSFLSLKGRCHYCQKPISWQYPLVEITTGLLFVFLAHYSIYDLGLMIYWLAIACFLIVIFVYDLKHYIIPDKIIYPAIIIVFAYWLLGNLEMLLNPLIAALLASSFFLTIVLVSKGKWMGLGDVKLAFFMGLFLGWPNILVALFLAFFFGAIIGIGLIAFSKKTLKSEVPFGPFLIIGTFVVLFFGENLINWYLNLFLL